jgi:hypothetical protein
MPADRQLHRHTHRVAPLTAALQPPSPPQSSAAAAQVTAPIATEYVADPPAPRLLLSLRAVAPPIKNVQTRRHNATCVTCLFCLAL